MTQQEVSIAIDLKQAFDNNGGVLARTCALLGMALAAFEHEGHKEEATAMEEAIVIITAIHETMTGIPRDKFEDWIMAQAYAIGYETQPMGMKH